MDHDSPNSSPTRKSSTSSRNSSISSQVSEYSLLILSLDHKIVPFPPVEWSTDPFPVSKHWTQISDSQKTKLVSDHAVDLFRENQSQHGTNVVVRMDLQYNEVMDQYSSTSITKLPDFESQTPALVQSTVPGGTSALTTLLAALKRQAAENEIAEIVRVVLELDEVEAVATVPEQDSEDEGINIPTDIVHEVLSLQNEVNKIDKVSGFANHVGHPESMQPAVVA